MVIKTQILLRSEITEATRRLTCITAEDWNDLIKLLMKKYKYFSIVFDMTRNDFYVVIE